MEFFQYSVLEKLKDQLIFSSKYYSRVKVLLHPVLVFCNEMPDETKMKEFDNDMPDETKMTKDRYNVTQMM